jgi:hypothetical protein
LEEIKQAGVKAWAWGTPSPEEQDEQLIKGNHIYGEWNNGMHFFGKKSEDTFRLRTTNEGLAKAAKYLDFANEEVLPWLVKLS